MIIMCDINPKNMHRFPSPPHNERLLLLESGFTPNQFKTSPREYAVLSYKSIGVFSILLVSLFVVCPGNMGKHYGGNDSIAVSAQICFVSRL